VLPVQCVITALRTRRLFQLRATSCRLSTVWTKTDPRSVDTVKPEKTMFECPFQFEVSLRTTGYDPSYQNYIDRCLQCKFSCQVFLCDTFMRQTIFYAEKGRRE
jgi:hypothetical protein